MDQGRRINIATRRAVHAGTPIRCYQSNTPAGCVEAVFAGKSRPGNGRHGYSLMGYKICRGFPDFPNCSHSVARKDRDCIGVEDIATMRHIYGNVPGNEIMNSCSSHSFLRLNDWMTAEWASQLTSTTTTFKYHPKAPRYSIAGRGGNPRLQNGFIVSTPPMLHALGIHGFSPLREWPSGWVPCHSGTRRSRQAGNPSFSHLK